MKLSNIKNVLVRVELFDSLPQNQNMDLGFETGAVVYEGPPLSEVRSHIYDTRVLLSLGDVKLGEVFPVGNVNGFLKPDLDKAMLPEGDKTCQR